MAESSFSAKIRMAREALRRVERRLGLERRALHVPVELERRAQHRREADRVAHGKPDTARDGIGQTSADRPAATALSYFVARGGRSSRRGSTNQRTNAIAPRILLSRRAAKLGLSFSFQ